MFNNKVVLSLGTKRVSFTLKANGLWDMRKYRINNSSATEEVNINTEKVGEIMDSLYQDGYTIVA